jgi:hypothetical protein
VLGDSGSIRRPRFDLWTAGRLEFENVLSGRAFFGLSESRKPACHDFVETIQYDWIGGADKSCQGKRNNLALFCVGLIVVLRLLSAHRRHGQVTVLTRSKKPAKVLRSIAL